MRVEYAASMPARRPFTSSLNRSETLDVLVAHRARCWVKARNGKPVAQLFDGPGQQGDGLAAEVEHGSRGLACTVARYASAPEPCCQPPGRSTIATDRSARQHGHVAPVQCGGSCGCAGRAWPRF